VRAKCLLHWENIFLYWVHPPRSPGSFVNFSDLMIIRCGPQKGWLLGFGFIFRPFPLLRGCFLGTFYFSNFLPQAPFSRYARDSNSVESPPSGTNQGNLPRAQIPSTLDKAIKPIRSSRHLNFQQGKLEKGRSPVTAAGHGTPKRPGHRIRRAHLGPMFFASGKKSLRSRPNPIASSHGCERRGGSYVLCLILSYWYCD